MSSSDSEFEIDMDSTDCALSDFDCSCQSDSDHDSTAEQDSCEPFSQPFLQLLHFLLVWQAVYRLSNATIAALLRFLKYFVVSIASAFNIAQLKLASKSIPLTKEGILKAIELHKVLTFTEFVVCPTCDSIYAADVCKRGGKFVSKTCCHRPFPNHPMQQKRLECGTQLMKTVRTKNGSVWKPRKIYPYYSLHKAIQNLASRPGFLECCEQWRERNDFKSYGYLSGIYDGSIWEEYKEFVSAPYNYLLTMNVDWFSPFEHGRYSVGVIYLTIQNLPITIRNNPENIILVGIIPGPSEPHLTINSYLHPLKEELLSAWMQGIDVPINEPGELPRTIVIRVALTCVACDIPASRKVCGFLGIRALFACNKCLKNCVHVQEDNSMWTNYSGFDKSEWVMRTNEDHRRRCDIIRQHFQSHCTKSSLNEVESLQGLRYSILLDLPYFDPIRYTVIDPMHNLFLGTGKHVMDVWLNCAVGAAIKQNMMKIEKAISEFVVPDGIGRLPRKITSHFGGFTADQWRNWIVIYSSVVLWNVIEKDHMNCWLLFVKAVRNICGRFVRCSDISKCDMLLQQFCMQFQQLYGAKCCTMNMHLHLHLCKCIEDFGPTYGFWLYAFERYNGILGSFHTNNVNIETQIMKRFLELQFSSHAPTLTTLANCNSEFLNVLPNSEKVKHGYCQEFNLHKKGINMVQLLELPNGPLNVTLETLSVFYSLVKPVGPFKEKVLTEAEIGRLSDVFSHVFTEPTKLKSVYYLKFGKLMLGSDLIGSKMPGCSANSSIIMANWPATPLSSQPVCSVGQVQYFLEVVVTHSTINETTDNAKPLVTETKYYFAYVLWNKPHPNADDMPTDVGHICETLAIPPCQWSFLPVHRIANRCAQLTIPMQFESMQDYMETVSINVPLTLRLTIY